MNFILNSCRDNYHISEKLTIARPSTSYSWWRCFLSNRSKHQIRLVRSWLLGFPELAFLITIKEMLMSSLCLQWDVCMYVPEGPWLLFSFNKLLFYEFMKISILDSFKDFSVTLSFWNSHIDHDISCIIYVSVKMLLHIFDLPEQLDYRHHTSWDPNLAKVVW